MFKPVIVVPVYRHIDEFAAFLPELLDHKIPIIVIDDGNDSATLRKLCHTYSMGYELLDMNRGKGAAVIRGFESAISARFTHALQIDADGQHAAADIPKFLDEADRNLTAIINAKPIYGEDAPRSRVAARKITNFWVMVETLSRKIPDAMCGFRVYPLAPLSKILKKLRFLGMGFDIEIIVLACRLGIPIINIPTKVSYPKAGRSNFRAFRDTALISLLHTYLVFTLPFGWNKE